MPVHTLQHAASEASEALVYGHLTAIYGHFCMAEYSIWPVLCTAIEGCIQATDDMVTGPVQVWP